MEGKTIKTLAEYIARLHKIDQSLLHPEERFYHNIDVNVVEQENVEASCPPPNSLLSKLK